MFTAPLFVTAKIQKQLNCPSTNEQIKKLWYTHTHYLATKKKEMVPFVTTWMDLKDITLSKISQRKTNTI